MKAKKIIAIYLRLSSEDKDEDKDESNSCLLYTSDAADE